MVGYGPGPGRHHRRPGGRRRLRRAGHPGRIRTGQAAALRGRARPGVDWVDEATVIDGNLISARTRPISAPGWRPCWPRWPTA